MTRRSWHSRRYPCDVLRTHVSKASAGKERRPTVRTHRSPFPSRVASIDRSLFVPSTERFAEHRRKHNRHRPAHYTVSEACNENRAHVPWMCRLICFPSKSLVKRDECVLGWSVCTLHRPLAVSNVSRRRSTSSFVIPTGVDRILSSTWEGIDRLLSSISREDIDGDIDADDPCSTDHVFRSLVEENRTKNTSCEAKTRRKKDTMQAALVHVPVPIRQKNSSRRRRGKKPGHVKAVWLDNVAKVEAPVPVTKAFELWNDRAQIPAWMPWITSVTVMDEDPTLSRWTLSTDPLNPPFNRPFGQRLEYSWLAKNLTPLPNQKVHWTSVEGLSNRGAVRFYSQGVETCTVELTISYECPDVLLPVASAVRPLVERILVDDLKRFASYAVEGSATDKDTPSQKENV